MDSPGLPEIPHRGAGGQHNSHAEQASVIRRYIAWRNRHAATHPRLREVVTKAETIKRAKVA